MQITKEQWQRWACEYAANSADDFASHVKLSLEEHIILKAKIEQAALYGIELTATMIKFGADINQAQDMKAALFSAGDKTYTMKLDGNSQLIHETKGVDVKDNQ